MILFLLSYIGGVLTILSPCILPVLPFVFARSDQPFLRSGLPLLVGMAITFAGVATLATLGGSWAVHANQWGRIAAMVLLALFGLTLLLPQLADHLTRPLVALGSRLSNDASAGQGGAGSSLLLGVATGLLWAPCAGPILGLILTGAAIKGASTSTTLLLLAYALGAATSLAAALLIGGRVFTAMKKSLGVGEWVRRALGVLVLAGVAAIALGLDTGLLTQLSLTRTTGLEQSLLQGSGLGRKTQSIAVAGSSLPVEGTMPELNGAVEWLNSPPLTRASLRGKVVLVDFWTYSCINCLRALPYVEAWAQKYRNHGLVVIGVHAPEFAFEKVPDNVKRAVHDLGVTYPVALDNNLAIWQAFNNEYWPAHYFIDAQGRIRHHHFGEGEYDESERVIQQLLREAGNQNVPGGIVDPRAQGVQAAATPDDPAKSPETYVGYGRGENFAAGPVHQDEPANYETPFPLQPNQWGFTGRWTIGEEKSALDAAGGKITFRFHARDLHLVLGPGSDGKPVRFKVTLDGQAPGASHGTDTDDGGNGMVTSQRLYQLIRLDNTSAMQADHTFAIQFLDPGVQAFAFTFG
ncbi:MAG TPA: cytochrome c biogenesis protein DipZ [Rhizomicrobium sp.]|jgi:cytochrome c biogenesis protein CcdA/thiol-disulfide isomerase/thioredoxin|nr:cytochrome c biogenesis protein DipZ [Rhizomicrobium sp.]